MAIPITHPDQRKLRAEHVMDVTAPRSAIRALGYQAPTPRWSIAGENHFIRLES